MNGKRVGLYLRVSTGEQTIDNQREALMAAIERRGWHIVSEFEDNGVSGAQGRTKRPGFDKLIKAATTRKIDVVAAWSIDRLGRSLRDLVNFLAELDAVGCDLYLEKQAIDTTTPAGRALFQMLGVFAEFEREMIRERVCAGLARGPIFAAAASRHACVPPARRLAVRPKLRYCPRRRGWQCREPAIQRNAKAAARDPAQLESLASHVLPITGPSGRNWVQPIENHGGRDWD